MLFIAQRETTPVKGFHENTPRINALASATLAAEPGETLENATSVIRDGLIESGAESTSIPENARIWDMTGKTVYK